MDEIGLFQLENLSLTPTHFVFFDLRSPRESLPPQIAQVLRRARSIGAEEALAEVRSLSPNTPIVLVCADGQRSKQLAERFEALGFQQVYIVAGGVAGLISEL